MKWLVLMLRTAGLLLMLAGVSAAPPDLRAEAQPPPNPCTVFVTGGGSFTPTSAGPGKATFGFNAGYKNTNQPLRGELNYIDHNTGMKLKATSVTTYQAFNCTDCADRFFGGDAEVNGVPGFLYSV